MAFKGEPGPKCPVCQNEGRSTSLELYQINLTEAVYLCKLGDCAYPKGYSWIFVNRRVFNTSDSDSDSSIDDEFSSILSTDSNIVTCNVSQNEKKEDCSIVDKAVNRPCNSGNHATYESSSIYTNTCLSNVLEITNDKIKVLNIEVKEENLHISTEQVKHSTALDILKSNSIGISNDLLIFNDNISINSTQVNEAIELCNSVPQLGISFEADDLSSSINTDTFNIESIPVVFAESEEGKQLLASAKQNSECSAMIIEPLGQNIKLVDKRNELTSNKIISIKPIKKCDRDVNKETNNFEKVPTVKPSMIIEPVRQNIKIVGKRNELTSNKIISIKPIQKCDQDINKETNNFEKVSTVKKSFGQLLAYERHALLWDIQKKCDKMYQNRNSKTSRLSTKKSKVKCLKPKQKHKNGIPEAIVKEARAILRKKEMEEKSKQGQFNEEEKLNTKNISNNRLNIIPGKNSPSKMKSTETCFDGFKYRSVIVKAADTTKKKENESKKDVCQIKDTSAVTQNDSVNRVSPKVEFNLDEQLNTFFHNIDDTIPMNNAVDNEDVDDWLKSLCSMD